MNGRTKLNEEKKKASPLGESGAGNRRWRDHGNGNDQLHGQRSLSDIGKDRSIE